MKNLMLSTAILAAAGGAALAQDTAPLFRNAPDAMELRASDFIGMRVYASEAALDATEYAGAQEGWQDIGEINDIVLTREGDAAAVLVDIGGFLGMGERQVAVDMAAIRFVSDASTADNAGDFFLVMNAARVDLEAAPAYMTGMAPAAATATTTAAAPTIREPILRDGYAAAEPDFLTAEKLTGSKVYDSTDTWIGDVSQLILSDDGAVTDAIIDVGGFLGMGAKPVALKLTDIDILRTEGGDEVRVYVAMTKEQLKALPTFEG